MTSWATTSAASRICLSDLWNHHPNSCSDPLDAAFDHTLQYRDTKVTRNEAGSHRGADSAGATARLIVIGFLRKSGIGRVGAPEAKLPQITAAAELRAMGAQRFRSDLAVMASGLRCECLRESLTRRNGQSQRRICGVHHNPERRALAHSVCGRIQMQRAEWLRTAPNFPSCR